MTDLMSEQQPRDIQDDLRLAKQVTAGSVPIIDDVPDVLVTLPRGLFHMGQWMKNAVVRELTGADEEALAKVHDQLAFYGTVIALAVESIGDLDFSSLSMADRKGYLNQLLLGERDMLFMKAAQTSFGNEREMSFACTLCESDQTVTLLLDQDFVPQDGKDLDVAVHQYTTAKGDVLDYRPATGGDQEDALSRKGASLAEQNTIILSRCITQRNGKMIVDPHAFARNLSIKDRHILLAELVALQPVIDLRLKTECSSCGGDQTLALGWGDIFRT